MAQFKDIGEGLHLGAQPTSQDLQEAKKLGIKSIIDFRMRAETSTPNEILVTQHGLNYVNIPVSKTNPAANQIEELDLALQQEKGPYLLHCGTGMRAAMMLALSRAKRNHWNAEWASPGSTYTFDRYHPAIGGITCNNEEHSQMNSSTRQ